MLSGLKNLIMWYNFNDKLPHSQQIVTVCVGGVLFVDRFVQWFLIDPTGTLLDSRTYTVGDYDLNSLRKLNALWTVEPKESLKF